MEQERKPDVGESKYLAEYMNRRKAKKEKKTLVEKYWNTPEWKTEYIKQIKEATALLRYFSLEAIIAALNTKEFNWAYSLKCKGLIDIIKREQLIIDRRNKLNEFVPESDAAETKEQIITLPKTSISKPVNKKSKFEGLDD